MVLVGEGEVLVLGPARLVGPVLQVHPQLVVSRLRQLMDVLEAWRRRDRSRVKGGPGEGGRDDDG